VGKIVCLSGVRKKRRAIPVHSTASEMKPAYFCTRCNSELFALLASGAVQCGKCGAMIENLQAVERKNDKQAGDY
jgi:transcription elongation factor Elf1